MQSLLQRNMAQSHTSLQGYRARYESHPRADNATSWVPSCKHLGDTTSFNHGNSEHKKIAVIYDLVMTNYNSLKEIIHKQRPPTLQSINTTALTCVKLDQKRDRDMSVMVGEVREGLDEVDKVVEVRDEKEETAEHLVM